MNRPSSAPSVSRPSTPPATPPPSGGGSREPTVAQWARAQAMHGVTRIVTGSRVIISDQDARRLEKITENWARYIETGKWDAEQ